MAPQVDFSTQEERLEFVQERYRCKAPACGGCLSCRLPGGLSAIDTFRDYIEGRTEYATIAAKLWK